MSAYALEPTVVTAATFTPRYATHNNSVILMGAAALAVTLPAATGSGMRFTFVSSVVASAQSIATTGSDTFVGGLSSATTTTGAGTHEALGGSDATISFNGTTTGGLIGTKVEVIDVAAGVWAVDGRLVGSGTLATPVS